MIPIPAWDRRKEEEKKIGEFPFFFFLPKAIVVVVPAAAEEENSPVTVSLLLPLSFILEFSLLLLLPLCAFGKVFFPVPPLL